MSKIGTTTITSKSGTGYHMNVYPGNVQFNDFIPGVYIVARQDGDSTSAIFAGETDNVDSALRTHDKQACFEEHHYDRILFFRNASKDVRARVLADLLPILKPVCND